MTRTTLILIAFVMATGCADNGSPVGPTPITPTPVVDVRPVHSRFNDLLWQQLVFDQYDNPGRWRPCQWCTTGSRVLDTTSPNVYIWLGDEAGQRVVAPRHVADMRRLIPRAMRQLTGHAYRGRIETGLQDRKSLGWITVRFVLREGDNADLECGAASVGANPGNIWIARREGDHAHCGGSDDRWFRGTFVHEIGHAMGFRHVEFGVMGFGELGDTTFTAREQYHAQLAYEVGRGHEYCGWPFQRSCATPKRVPRTLGVARVVID